MYLRYITYLKGPLTRSACGGCSEYTYRKDFLLTRWHQGSLTSCLLAQLINDTPTMSGNSIPKGYFLSNHHCISKTTMPMQLCVLWVPLCC